MHTLVLAGRFYDKFHFTDTNEPVLLLATRPNGQVYAAPPGALPIATLDYQTKLEMYSVEAQQIWEHDQHTVVAGGRYQTGTFETHSDLGSSSPTHLASGTNVLPASQPGL